MSSCAEQLCRHPVHRIGILGVNLVSVRIATSDQQIPSPVRASSSPALETQSEHYRTNKNVRCAVVKPLL